MLCTVQFACTLPKAEADAQSVESGRIYTDMLVRHYRLYRKQGVWLAPKSGKHLEDALGGPTTLHAHSRDAAKPRLLQSLQGSRNEHQIPPLAQALQDDSLEKSEGHRAQGSLSAKAQGFTRPLINQALVQPRGNSAGV